MKVITVALNFEIKRLFLIKLEKKWNQSLFLQFIFPENSSLVHFPLLIRLMFIVMPIVRIFKEQRNKEACPDAEHHRFGSL